MVLTTKIPLFFCGLPDSNIMSSNTTATTSMAASMPNKRKLETTTTTTTPTKSKKERRRATIQRVFHEGKAVFSLPEHVQQGTPVRSKMATIIPLSYGGNRPVLVQLEGGGRIPSFGVDQNEDKPNKFNIVFNVESDEEYKCLQDIRDDLSTLATEKWSSWFPDQKKPSDELIREQCNSLVSKRTPKQNTPNQFWSGTLKSNVDKADVETDKCQLRDRDTGDRLQLEDLAGMNWHKAVVELRSVYVLANRSYGISKRLRYLECSEGPLAEEIIPL